jgi:hypothetical protein
MDLIDEYRAVFPAVARYIALSIAVYVEPAHHARAFNRRFPDARMDGVPLPSDVAR